MAALQRAAGVGLLDPSAPSLVSATVPKWASGGAARFDYARAAVASETSRPRQTSSRLRSDEASFPLLPCRTTLDQRRAHVAPALAALAALDQYCSILVEQMTFVDAFAAWDADLAVIGYQHDPEPTGIQLATLVARLGDTPTPRLPPARTGSERAGFVASPRAFGAAIALRRRRRFNDGRRPVLLPTFLASPGEAIEVKAVS